MGDYVILTDSSCDLPKSMILDMNVKVIQLDIIIDGEGMYKNDAIDVKECYKKLRDGASIKTSAVNMSDASEIIEKLFKEEKDVLYLGFSSALSGTFQIVASTGKELLETYTNREFIAIDTLAASMGQGLLVYKACQAKKEGKTLKETAVYIESIKLNLCHQFTVNDLFFLKRGGRVSGVTATLGTMLSIKPILHVDNEGRLINVGKVRGRKTSIAELYKRMEATVIDPEKQTVFISHGDCIEDAEKLADMIKENLKVKDIVISYVGPVIGAHSGPGTLALFYEGTER